MFPVDGSHFGKVDIDDITERRFPGRPEIDEPSRLLHCRQLGDRPLVRLGVAQENPGLSARLETSSIDAIPCDAPRSEADVCEVDPGLG